MAVTLDCEGCRLTYSNSGTVYITGADNSADTYEIPLEIWRLFNEILEKMEARDE
jgi:hypothetical protein